MSDSPRVVSFWERQRTLWRDNHGGLILVVMGGVFLVGMGTLAFRQSRFRPPRFPDSSAIRGKDSDSLVTTVHGDVPASEALAIKVSGSVNDSGTMFLAIYEKEEGFNISEKASLRATQSIVDGVSVFTFRAKDLPRKLAIAAYHDENSDGQLTYNAIGIPIERYGFSNNARGTLGPPKFEEVVVDRPDSGSIDIYIR